MNEILEANGVRGCSQNPPLLRFIRTRSIVQIINTRGWVWQTDFALEKHILIVISRKYDRNNRSSLPYMIGIIM